MAASLTISKILQSRVSLWAASCWSYGGDDSSVAATLAVGAPCRTNDTDPSWLTRSRRRDAWLIITRLGLMARAGRIVFVSCFRFFLLGSVEMREMRNEGKAVGWATLILAGKEAACVAWRCAPGARRQTNGEERESDSGSNDPTGVEELQPGSLGAICGYFLLSLHHLKVPQKPERDIALRACWIFLMLLMHFDNDGVVMGRRKEAASVLRQSSSHLIR